MVPPVMGGAGRTAAGPRNLPAPPIVESGNGRDRRVRVLVTLVWAWVVLPRVIQSLTASKHRQSIGVDGGGYTRLAGLTKEALLLAVAAASVWLIVESFRHAERPRPLPLILLLVPWLYLVARDLYADGRPSTSALLYPLVVVAVWAARPSVSALRILGYLTVLAAVISMAMAVVDPSSALFRSGQGIFISEDKQILSSGMLTGFLTQPNNLGQFIALGLPLVGLLPRRRLRRLCLGICAFAIVWTASRSSMYAVGITAITALVFAMSRHPAMRRVIAGCALIVAFAVVCVLPVVTRDPLAFSARGGIWQASLPVWHDNVWFGQGANWYQDLARTSSAIGSYAFHGHNQFVQLLVTGGLCYVIVAGMMLWLAGTASVRLAARSMVCPALYLVALAGTCLLEVSLVAVDNVSMFPMVVIPLAVICCARDVGPLSAKSISRSTHRLRQLDSVGAGSSGSTFLPAQGAPSAAGPRAPTRGASTGGDGTRTRPHP